MVSELKTMGFPDLQNAPHVLHAIEVTAQRIAYWEGTVSMPDSQSYNFQAWSASFASPRLLRFDPARPEHNPMNQTQDAPDLSASGEGESKISPETLAACIASFEKTAREIEPEGHHEAKQHHAVVGRQVYCLVQNFTFGQHGLMKFDPNPKVIPGNLGIVYSIVNPTNPVPISMHRYHKAIFE